MKRALLLTVLVLLTASARPARADVGDWESNYDPGKAQRRSGFAAGASLGGMFGNVSGYPNEVAKIDVPEFEASTDLAGGTAGGFWVGAALRDFLVFGVGLTFGTVAGGQGKLSNGGAFVLHVEGFPLFYQGGVFEDLGVIAEFGAGARDVFIGSREAANGGLVSYAAFGFLYEPIRIGEHVSTGPMLLLSHQFSNNLTATFVTAGMQLTVYGGPG